MEGPFRSEFWSTVVPALIQDDSIVRHAIYALSTAHESYLTDGATVSSLESYGLHYYQKSLREVSKLDDATEHFDSFLCICLIFYSLASLHGRFDEATRHAIAGLKMIAEMPHRRSASPITDNALFQIFLELRDQVCQANDDSFDQYSARPLARLSPVTRSFRTPEDLLIQLSLLSFEILGLSQEADALHATEPWVRGSVAPAIQPTYEAALHNHAQISEALSSMEKTFSNHPTARQREACLTIRVFLISLSIDLEVFVNGEEVYDSHIEDNFTILRLIEEALFQQHSNASSTTTSPQAAPVDKRQETPFVSSLGIIALLFEIATRTGIPSLRTSAINLLYRANRREGIWDSRVAARLAERLIVLNDEGIAIANGTTGTTTAMSSTTHLPMSCSFSDQPETVPNTKFIITDIRLLSDRKAKVTYGFKKRRQPVTIGIVDDIGGSPDSGVHLATAEEFESFWFEGVPPGEGELREEIIELD